MAPTKSRFEAMTVEGAITESRSSQRCWRIACTGACRPNRTLLEPSKGRKPPDRSLLEVLIAHYDELDRLLAARDGASADAGDGFGAREVRRVSSPAR